jgi:hypothetical protein
VKTSFWALLSLAVPFLLATHARAQDSARKEACVAKHAESQKLKKAGKLSEAKERLLECASEACPAPIRAECGQWAQEVEANMPSVLIEVRGEGGELRSDVEVWIDGTRRAESLTGMSLAIDPGEHTIEARTRGERQSKRVLVNLGAKAQSVVFTLEKGKPSRAQETRVPPKKSAASSGPPVASYVFGSLGIVALGVGGYFGYTAKTRADELEDCRPRCDRDEADAMRDKALVADISLGVGVIALGVASVLWLSDGQRSEAGTQRLRGRARPNSSMRWMSVRREIPSSLAARVWLPAL